MCIELKSDPEAVSGDGYYTDLISREGSEERHLQEMDRWMMLVDVVVRTVLMSNGGAAGGGRGADGCCCRRLAAGAIG